MMKFGTPIGAGPKSAIVRSGLASVGVPSGARSGCSSIGSRSWPSPCPCWSPPSRSLVVRVAVAVPRPPPPLAPIDPPPTPLPPVAAAAASSSRRRSARSPVGRAAGGRRRDRGRRRRRRGRRRRGGADSVASSGPVQSGSARSLRPSPSSSARFEHCGRTWAAEVLAVGQVDLDAALADPDHAPGPGAGSAARDHEAPRIGEATAIRSLLLIPKCPVGSRRPGALPPNAGEMPSPELRKRYLLDQPLATR